MTVDHKLPAQISQFMDIAAQHEKNGQHHHHTGNTKLKKAHMKVAKSFKDLVKAHYDHVNTISVSEEFIESDIVLEDEEAQKAIAKFNFKQKVKQRQHKTLSQLKKDADQHANHANLALQKGDKESFHRHASNYHTVASEYHFRINDEKKGAHHFKQAQAHAEKHYSLQEQVDREFKRKEISHELRNEKPDTPAKRKATGLIYHSLGKQKDKNGNRFDFNHGSAEAGEYQAKKNFGRYSHFKEEINEEDFLENHLKPGQKIDCEKDTAVVKKAVNSKGDYLVKIKEGDKDFKLAVEGNLSKACWKGYKAIGTKKKDGREVPNCVPE